MPLSGEISVLIHNSAELYELVPLYISRCCRLHLRAFAVCLFVYHLCPLTTIMVPHPPMKSKYATDEPTDYEILYAPPTFHRLVLSNPF
jgi:hypothetical protein